MKKIIALIIFSLSLGVYSSDKLSTPEKQDLQALKKEKEEKKKESKYINPEALQKFSATFFFIPNAFSIRPISHKSLSTEGFITTDEFSRDSEIDNEFNLLSFWAISHIVPPYDFEKWILKFSPSINYYSWKQPGDIKFVHISYNAKLLYNFKNDWGTFLAGAGFGPMWINGNIFGQTEDNSFTISPRVQLAYYKFFNTRFFFQIKYTKHKLLESMFDGSNFEIDTFSTTGLYIGYYFGTL